jgi:hypothetical protein
MNLPELKVPWLSIDSDRGAKLTSELEREVGEGHVLFGKKVSALAVRQDCDDVLFEILGDRGACAVVHLTWSMKTEPTPKFPWTEVFPSIQEWNSLRMIPDHEDFTCA